MRILSIIIGLSLVCLSCTYNIKCIPKEPACDCLCTKDGLVVLPPYPGAHNLPLLQQDLILQDPGVDEASYGSSWRIILQDTSQAEELK